MCKCIDKLEEKIESEYVGKPFGRTKKNVIKGSFVSAALMFVEKPKEKNAMVTQATGVVELTLEGVKKPKEVPIVYSHCPFCGEKYPK